MIKLELTKAQRNVITTICGIEVEALSIILDDGPSDESKFIIEQYEVSEEEFKIEIARMRSGFIQILEDPEKLFQLEDDISLFKHILFNLESAKDRDDDCVTVLYPIAVKNLWRKLFAAEEFIQITNSALAN